MGEVVRIHPKRAEPSKSVHPSARKESIDDYLKRVEEIRQRKDLDPRVRRAMETTLNRLGLLIDLVYEMNDAATNAYSATSGPSQAPSGGGVSDPVGERVASRLSEKENKGRPLRRTGPLDRYMRQNVVNEFNTLTRSICHITTRAEEARNGNPRRRAKLSAAQVEDIRRRLDENESKQSLADEFGVSHGAIRSIADGRTWKGS